MNTRLLPRGLAAIYAQGLPTGAEIIADLNAAFDKFKADHRKDVDQLTRSVDGLMQSQAALQVGAGAGFAPATRRDTEAEYQAWGSYVRSGDASGLANIQASMSVGSDPDGGYTVSPAMGDAIKLKTFDMSPIGRLARRVEITTGDAFEEPWDVSDIAAEWVGEKEARPPLGTSKLNLLSWPVHEIYTNQPITQRLLDDSRFNLGQWLEGKVSEKFARATAATYVHGDGILKPRGILTYDISTESDAARPFGTIQYVPTGAADDFIPADATDSPADVLFDVIYSLRAPYRSNARWLTNLNTAGVVRKLKDTEGRFIWADAREGQPARLAGFPVELDEEMPDIGANSLSIAFGDFGQGYIVVDKPGIRMLRDPYTSKPNVLIYAYATVHLLRFYAPDIDKRAILKEPALIRGIKGLRILPAQENLFVKPVALDLAEGPGAQSAAAAG